MADSQIASLFMTPEMYQQDQNNKAIERANAFAQLDPAQRAAQSMYYGGYQAGNAIAGALGGQDPMLQRQSLRANILKSINPSDPKSWQQAIMAANQQGDGDFSGYLLGKYKENVQIAKDQSVISKNEAWEAAKTDSEKKRNLLASVEQDLLDGKEVDPKHLNQAKLVLAQETRPKMFQQADGTIVQVPGIDVNLFPNIGKAIGKTGAVAGSSGTQVASAIETPATIEAKTSRAKSLQEGSTQLDELLTRIGDTEKLVSPWSTQWGAKFLDTMPGSEALTLKDNTNTIKNNIAITKLQELKDKSKTGASGLGQLSDKDMATVKELIAGLNPMSANYAKDLGTIKAFFVRAKKAMEDEARLTQEKVEAVKPSSMSGKNPQIKDTEGAWLEQAMKLNPNYTREQVIKKGIEAGKLSAGYK